MKKTATLSLLFLSFLAFAQGIKFDENNFDNLLKKAKKENKLIFVDAYTTWCGPCKLMAKNIFPLQAVGEYYNSHFVNAKIDMEKGEGITIAKKYNVKAFPTYLFINGDGEEVHRTLGYVEEKDFIQFAKDAEDPNKRLTSLKQKFEKGELNSEGLKNLAGLVLYSEPELGGKVTEKYFATKKSDLNMEDVQLLLSGIQSSESPLYKIYKERKADIIKVFPEDNYNKFEKSLKINGALKKSVNLETKKLDETKFLAELKTFLPENEANLVIKKIQANKALGQKDIATYEKLTLEINKDYTNLSSMELNTIAWNFFEKVSTKSSLETALKWAQESVKKDENSANTDTLANLYNKLGDKKNAKIWAQKSVELAKAKGEDYSDTETLLKSL